MPAPIILTSSFLIEGQSTKLKAGDKAALEDGEIFFKRGGRVISYADEDTSTRDCFPYHTSNDSFWTKIRLMGAAMGLNVQKDGDFECTFIKQTS